MRTPCIHCVRKHVAAATSVDSTEVCGRELVVAHLLEAEAECGDLYREVRNIIHRELEKIMGAFDDHTVLLHRASILLDECVLGYPHHRYIAAGVLCRLEHVYCGSPTADVAIQLRNARLDLMDPSKDIGPVRLLLNSLLLDTHKTVGPERLPYEMQLSTLLGIAVNEKPVAGDLQG